jgi:FAD/FMN-containing dehydrogenase
MDTYYDQVCTLGGSIAGEYGEGRLRGAYLQKMFQPEMLELMTKIKAAFDPHNVLNPGVKVGIDIEQVKPLIRRQYSLQHQYLYLPRS